MLFYVYQVFVLDTRGDVLNSCIKFGTFQGDKLHVLLVCYSKLTRCVYWMHKVIEWVDNPECVARGVMNTLLSVSSTHTWWALHDIMLTAMHSSTLSVCIFKE